jgi:plastocyanin
MRAVATAAMAVALLAALGGVAGAVPETTFTVGDNFIRPGKKTVVAGTRVRFRWTGAATHHIVKAKGPGGPIASPFASKQGVNLARRLRQPGTYRFVCTIHPTEMRTKVVVVR